MLQTAGVIQLADRQKRNQKRNSSNKTKSRCLNHRLFLLFMTCFSTEKSNRNNPRVSVDHCGSGCGYQRETRIDEADCSHDRCDALASIYTLKYVPSVYTYSTHKVLFFLPAGWRIAVSAKSIQDQERENLAATGDGRKCLASKRE